MDKVMQNAEPYPFSYANFTSYVMEDLKPQNS